MINPVKPKINPACNRSPPVFPSIEIRESEHSSTLESVHACGNESDAEWSPSRCGPEAQKDRRKEMRPVNDHGDALAHDQYGVVLMNTHAFACPAAFIHTHKDPGQSEKVSSMKYVESIGIFSHLDLCNIRLNLCLWFKPKGIIRPTAIENTRIEQ
ncbi:hypothetical protein OIU74_028270 [Salix koriyanagi]|uniref:Uncharacterized protein n=1 Tax=Salix koriyanagi TaxID=2511006 RepID=A0A9Q0VB80_9ROSI|nr:hypothetical protein OIU74_028270 [Salix koriyanagi]